MLIPVIIPVIIPVLIPVLIPEPVTALALPSASFFLNDSNRLKCSAPLVFALRS